MKAMTTLTQRDQIIEVIQTLPDDSIDELLNFIHYLQYKKEHLPSPPSLDSILDPNKTYEVWTPIDAPEATKTLMSLLAEQSATTNGSAQCHRG